MSLITLKFISLGENCLTVEFGNKISSELNDRVINLFRYLVKSPIAGQIELVPAYASLTIFYDTLTVRQNYGNFKSAFAAVKYLVENALLNLENQLQSGGRLIEIPVNFDKNYALDLEFVASHNNLTPDELIENFTSKTYRVFMLGFLPGFAYMGEVAEKIAAPRRQNPRLKVPKGSVGVAGRQTGIYPLESPGGWQIIGHTDFELFTPESENPCALQAGDLVKFYDSKK